MSKLKRRKYESYEQAVRRRKSERKRTMTAADMIRTCNEWMRRFIEEPEKFRREFESVADFLTDTAVGREPDYGERCTAYQFKLLEEMGPPTA